MNDSKTTLIPTTDDQDVKTWMDISVRDMEENDTDVQQAVTLRPVGFSDYIGQDQLKSNLSLACRASKKREDALDHVLLHGPPGLGKTSMAKIISTELGVGFKATSGPIIERPGDLAAILTSLKPRDILFIDEIHRIPRIVEEVLYPAMEDYQIDILIGQGPAAKSVKIDLKPFTLVGATTRTGLLTSPLRDRFGMVLRLMFYKPEELAHIITRSAGLLGIKIESDAALEMGRCSRGTPRIANRLLKRVRDYTEDTGCDTITLDLTVKALRLLDIDNHGLDRMDRMILEIIIDKFNGGPVGIDTIAAAIGEEKDTLEDVYEPYLIQNGLIARTKRGREATELAYQHLEREKEDTSQSQLGFKNL